jgi:hypothetical protein
MTILRRREKSTWPEVHGVMATCQPKKICLCRMFKAMAHKSSADNPHSSVDISWSCSISRACGLPSVHPRESPTSTRTALPCHHE